MQRTVVSAFVISIIIPNRILLSWIPSCNQFWGAVSIELPKERINLILLRTRRQQSFIRTDQWSIRKLGETSIRVQLGHRIHCISSVSTNLWTVIVISISSFPPQTFLPLERSVANSTAVPFRPNPIRTVDYLIRLWSRKYRIRSIHHSYWQFSQLKVSSISRRIWQHPTKNGLFCGRG